MSIEGMNTALKTGSARFFPVPSTGPIKSPPPASVGPKPLAAGLTMLLPLDTAASPVNLDDYSGWDKPYLPVVRSRTNWTRLQPTSGTFYWTFLDAVAAKCAVTNKDYIINIGAGVTGTPSWVTSNGVTLYTVHASDESVAGQMGLPWDPVYRALYKAMIQQVHDRYSADPHFKEVVAEGFSQGGTMYFGSAGDELNLPTLGYPSVDAAWTAGVQAMLTDHMTVFTRENVTITYVKPFPTSSGGATGSAVTNWFYTQWPGRAGVGVSSLYATSGPHGAQQDVKPHWFQEFALSGGQAVLMHDYSVNPSIYKANPGFPIPVPYPTDWLRALSDLLENGLYLRGQRIEIYQGDIKGPPTGPAPDAVLSAYNAALLANVPTP